MDLAEFEKQMTHVIGITDRHTLLSTIFFMKVN